MQPGKSSQMFWKDLPSGLAYCSTVMREMANFSKMLVEFYQTAQHRILEDSSTLL
jgi:hypothetical protein